MITIKNIYKKFRNLQVLRNINLQLEKGECIALIGPNGCGKTTLIKSILGIVIPDKGEIFFKNHSIFNTIDYRKYIGYMPQKGIYPENMTIGQIIEMIKGIQKYYCQYDEELYNHFEMDKLLHKRMGTLSGGTTQKVSATLAFLFNPEVLILDEPTAGFDPLASEILKNKIIKEQNKGKLILITSHLLTELDDLISQIIFMQEGNLIFHKNVKKLKSETTAKTVEKAILHILKNNIYK